MKRFNYKLNSVWHQWAFLQTLQPLAMCEVVPGDSVDGDFSWSFCSSPTDGPVQNELYLDTFLFYVPYRVAWSGWPNYIAAANTGNPDNITRPTSLPLWIGDANTTDPDADIPLLAKLMGARGKTSVATPNYGVPTLPMWCYWAIYNTYFRQPGLNPVTLSTNDPLTAAGCNPASVMQAHSDFHRASLLAGPTTSENIGSTVSSMRAAVARQRFQNIRDFYGDKYTDYLRSLGVEASSAVIENPELLARSSAQWKYKYVDNTTGWVSSDGEPEHDLGALGNFGGYYFTNGRLSMSRKFFSEHGLLLMVGCNRFRGPNFGASHPLWAKRSASSFWSPEYDRNETTAYPASLYQFNTGAARFTDTIETETYLDYKTGVQIDCINIADGNNFPTTPVGQHVSQVMPTSTVRGTMQGQYLYSALGLLGPLDGWSNPMVEPEYPVNGPDGPQFKLLGSGRITQSLNRVSPVSKLPSAL